MSSWFTVPRPAPRAQMRLICFPYAGAGPNLYRTWLSRLPEAVELVCASLPGRGSRAHEPLMTDLSEMASRMEAGMASLSGKAYALFGHSMGAMLAFEIARRMHGKDGAAPLHLFVSARSAPQLADADAPTYDLPDGEFIEELRRLNGVPREAFAHPELMELLLPWIRADFKAVQTYRHVPSDPLPLPITIFGGIADTAVPRPRLEPWKEQTKSQFALRMLPGDHFFIHTAEKILVESIARQLLRLIPDSSLMKPQQTLSRY